jgi:hypothetical protein
MKRHVARAALLALALGLGGPVLAGPDEPASRTIERTFAAESLKDFSVKGNVGRIVVSATTSDSIRLRLDLRARTQQGLFGSRKGDPNAAELDADSRSDAIDFGLRYAGDRDGLEETWTLEVPARLAAQLELAVGDMDVRGVLGGLRLSVNVGDIEADVPRGDITAKTNVGDIRVTSGSDSYGDVELEANVGDTHLTQGDHRVRHPKPAGAGNRISLDGPGRDRIRIKTNVGDVSLVLSSST